MPCFAAELSLTSVKLNVESVLLDECLLISVVLFQHLSYATCY